MRCGRCTGRAFVLDIPAGVVLASRRLRSRPLERSCDRARSFGWSSKRRTRPARIRGTSTISPNQMTVSLDAIARAFESQGLLVDRRGDLPDTATLITDDSRQVKPGSLFVAVRGADRDGHTFLATAARSGAAAAIVEDASATALPALIVRSSRRAAAIAGAVSVDWPAREMQLVGVTGTNGKTTTVGILRHLLDDQKVK